MDPNEIFEYITEGMKWLAIGSGIYVSYMATLLGLEGGKALLSEKIKSQEKLERVIEEEANKLGVDEIIKPFLHDKRSIFAIKGTDSSYEIHIGGFGARRNFVKHELYHIFKGDLENIPKINWLRKLKYNFIEEPKAILYATFEIKL